MGYKQKANFLIVSYTLTFKKLAENVQGFLNIKYHER